MCCDVWSLGGISISMHTMLYYTISISMRAESKRQIVR